MSSSSQAASLLRVIDVLENLNRIPTAPFHEESMARQILTLAQPLREDHRIRSFRDRFGNLVIGYSPGRPALEVVLVAHMDHPAFEVRSHRGETLELEVLGGLPWELLMGSRVSVVCGEPVAEAVVVAVDQAAGTVTGRLEAGEVRGSLVGLPAVLGLEAAEVDAEWFRAPVIDDLAGCAAILAALGHCVVTSPEVAVTGLFTRAEETGFVGASAAIAARTVNEDALVISLEASSANDEYPAGAGPVIRLGDRSFLFDANGTEVLRRAAAAVRETGEAVQEARMTGGVCEGSLFFAYGFAAAGMAIPLVNTHNRGRETVEREAARISDIEGEVAVLQQLFAILPESDYRPRGQLRQRLTDRFLKYRTRL
jgi:putative aminopeptidase FrvX